MELSKLFKGLIVFQFITVLVIFLVLPDDPILYEEITSILTVASIIYLFLWLVCLVLLFRFNPSGRMMFTILLIVGIFLNLSMPDSSVPNGVLVDTLHWFSGALDGLMLAILYLTDIKERFQ